MPSSSYSDLSPAELKAQCTIQIPGNKEPSPAEHFAEMAKWCEQHQVSHDVYGSGETIAQFEQKIAQLLGYEAGLFVITGTMTQPMVLEMVAKQKANPQVAMHPSSHILLHENQGYQLQNRFNALTLGSRYAPWTVDDLAGCPDKLAAVLYELPMREIGGQLPQWQELQAIKEYCKRQDIHLHMDGARLWECAAFYNKSYAEIANGFDTTYVSLYKGIGGMGGSILLGSKAFIDAARVWSQRVGGNVYHRTPYVVSAAMQFDSRLALMPKLFERTQQVYKLLESFDNLTPVPQAPQANMLHLIVPMSHQQALNLRDSLAKEQGIWIGNPQATAHPQQSLIEWYVGDQLLEMDDDTLARVLSVLNGGVERSTIESVNLGAR